MSTLKLRLHDVYGATVREPVEVLLQAPGSAQARRARLPHGDATIAELTSGVYRLRVDPPSFLPVQRFVTVPSEVSVPLAFDPAKVSLQSPASLELPSHVYDVLGGLSYTDLDALRKAGLLNVAAKATATVFGDGRSVWSYVDRVKEVRQDRCFCVVDAALRDQIVNAIPEGLFAEVSGALHHPPEGFTPAGSFKTADGYGNLQVTCFVRGSEWMADIDIDDAAGLGHVFQVMRNHLTGRPTHPYDIHQLLLQHQHLDTGYRLVPLPIEVRS